MLQYDIINSLQHSKLCEWNLLLCQLYSCQPRRPGCRLWHRFCHEHRLLHHQEQVFSLSKREINVIYILELPFHIIVVTFQLGIWLGREWLHSNCAKQRKLPLLRNSNLCQLSGCIIRPFNTLLLSIM